MALPTTRWSRTGPPSTLLFGNLLPPSDHPPVNAGLRGDWDKDLTGDASLFHVGPVTDNISQSFSALALLAISVPSSSVGGYNLINQRIGDKFWQEKAEAGYMRDAEVAFSAFSALNDKHKEHPLGNTIGSRI